MYKTSELRFRAVDEDQKLRLIFAAPPCSLEATCGQNRKQTRILLLSLRGFITSVLLVQSRSRLSLEQDDQVDRGFHGGEVAAAMAVCVQVLKC